ncbi:hypothetical protein M413DRAFT_443611 [Hebeloma cylindrosporum]|uniref:Uncharacterized protein n=1 Tax=Hebeloma cylindrosporum TaxID=76867 RepID=A0A0C3CJ23_HEBCY|nr:hypothetical protein M413DRAFT_443611 [Hebeloma cylindrosporum h7]
MNNAARWTDILFAFFRRFTLRFSLSSAEARHSLQSPLLEILPENCFYPSVFDIREHVPDISQYYSGIESNHSDTPPVSGA